MPFGNFDRNIYAKKEKLFGDMYKKNLNTPRTMDKKKKQK